MISESPACFGDPQKAALRTGGGPGTRHEAGIIALAIPALLYLASVWIVRPVPLAYVTPLLMVLGALAIKVPRSHFLESLHRLRFEFSLLAAMALLSVFSLANSDDPFRSLRIIYPCVLPMLLAWHLIATGSISRSWLLLIPRVLVVAGLLFSILPFLASFVLPPLKGFLFGEYRLKGFFENSIQHAIALATLVPILVTEIAVRRRSLARWAYVAILLALVYTLFRTGSKTAMFLSFSSGIALFAIIKVRAQSALKTISMAAVMVLVLALLWMFGLDIATRLNPTIGGKLREIVEGGVTNYQSVDSRELLWEEGLRMGKEHWVIGAGAGRKVLGISHSHNLIIDYFKGIGLFGATAVALLCLLIFGRMALKTAHVLKGSGDADDRRILACYVAASIYVCLNQMSDCFGPSTIGFLWTVYLTGVLSERSPATRVAHRFGAQPKPKAASV